MIQLFSKSVSNFQIKVNPIFLCEYCMVLETTIKVSNELKDVLKENKKEGETYNEMIISMYLRLKDQGWREYEGKF